MCEWINVETKLPEAGELVWLYCFEDYQQVGYFVDSLEFDDGISHTFKNVFDKYVSVTHWQPLSEPPEES